MTVFYAVFPRRKFLIVFLTSLGLASCSHLDSPGRVAFQLRPRAGYAIDLQRGFTRPVAPGDVTVFYRTAPQEWNRVQNAQTVERLVSDFNANPDRWQEMPSYQRQWLWGPPPEPPL